jgi:hypothetical protein
MRGRGEGRDVFWCALMRVLAGKAGLLLPWLHLKAILIVWLRSFVQAQHLRNLPPSPPPPPHRLCSSSAQAPKGGGWMVVVEGAHAPSIFVKFTQLHAPAP